MNDLAVDSLPTNSASWRIRLAIADDRSFLRQMLYEAAHWRPDQVRPPLEESLAREELAKLLAGWGSREGDLGVVAVLEEGSPVGAAWCRYWTADDHSYGYVDAETPELAIGVVAAQRRRGIGAALLTELLRDGGSRGIERLSLSVERDNPAVRLYQRHGFERIAEVGSASSSASTDASPNAWTMVAQTLR